MERRRKIKRTWILTIVTVIIGYILLEIFVGFFIRDFYINYRTQRVQKKIVQNYNNNKDAFQELIEYAQDLPLKETITFLSKNKFQANFSGHNYHPYLIENPDSFYYSHDFYQDSSLYFPLGDDNLEPFGVVVVSWDILPNRLGKIVYEDTTYYSYQWSWEFEGKKHDKYFSRFLKLCNITEKQLFKLQKLMQEINCHSISKNKFGQLHLIFAGHWVDNFGYYIHYPYEHFKYEKEYYNPKIYFNTTPLDSMIYSARFRSGMFCGYTIF